MGYHTEIIKYIILKLDSVLQIKNTLLYNISNSLSIHFVRKYFQHFIVSILQLMYALLPIITKNFFKGAKTFMKFMI